MGYSSAVVTAKGQELMEKVLAGESKITFTKVGTSEKAYAEYEEKQSLVPNIEKDAEDNVCKIKCVAIFSNTDLTEGYYINTIVLYAKGDDGEEIMFSYIETDGTGKYMEAYNSQHPQSIQFTIYTGLTVNDSSSVIIDPEGVATIKYVDSQIEIVDKKLNEEDGYIDSVASKTNLSTASADYLNKKCVVKDTNTIYKCVEQNGEYVWVKLIENGIIYATYAELKALKDAKGLVAGQKYRITDYVTTVNSSLTEYKSAGHQFDLIIEALDSETFSEDAKAIQHEGDTYFVNSLLETWEIKYSFDGSRFDWNDTTNGKGVIWKMKDENLNDYPYDFKNIMRKVYKVTANTKQTDYVGLYLAIKSYAIYTGQGDATIVSANSTIDESDYKWCYTFTKCDSQTTMTTIEDYSLILTEQCRGNFMALANDGDSQQIIHLRHQVNTFINTTGSCVYNRFLSRYSGGNIFGNDCHENTFESNCSNNSFGNSCYSNSFGNNCYSNSFGTSCSFNSFGNNCYSNSFGTSCYSNSFGNNCYSNSFGTSCSFNSFGNNCYSNSFGNNCSSNSFGNNCSSNSFGNNCYSNSFGNNCYSNSFGTSCSYNSFGNNCYSNSFGTSCSFNSFGNNCYSNSFGNNCSSNSFGNNCYSNSFGNNCYQNAFINVNVSNTFGEGCRYCQFEENACNNTLVGSSQAIHIGEDATYNTINEKINNGYISAMCNHITLTAHSIKVIAYKTNTTYSTYGQVVVS